jgi:Tol biopolymer transport system component
MRPLPTSLLGLLGATLSVSVTLAAASAAPAAFTAPTLLSGSAALQADYAYSPAISADGRYAVFTGSVASVTGVYRKDLQSQVLQLVAGGNASAPSVSADGRYVSFTTSDDPTTGNPTAAQCSAVYVRDMQRPTGETDAYQLASALDGSTLSLTYGGSGTPSCPGGGSATAARVALSADGRKVAFTVIGQSDLGQAAADIQQGTPPATETPPDQVVVRDLDTNTTTLISATLASQRSGAGEQVPVPGGAAIAGTEVDKGGISGIEEDGREHPVSAGTAAISADGSTVAWMGVNIPEQTPAAPEDEAKAVGNAYADDYDEPLWRRIAPGAPTQRILGGDDPAAPDGQGPLNLHWESPGVQLESGGIGPELGAYINQNGFNGAAAYQDGASSSTFESITPQLSADGGTVALLSTAPSSGAEPAYGAGRSEPTVPPTANAFIVDMTSGLTRSQALTRLTEWGADDFGPDVANTAPIDEIALSPDGTRVAFTTRRTIFPLTPPVLITPQVTTTSDSQLYEIDLRSDTLALVSQGYEGSPAEGNVYSPSFSGDGNTLVFASAAHNLVYGTVNSGNSDVFATSAITTPEMPGAQSVTPGPSDPPPTPEWRIGATTQRGPGGSLLLDVIVPGAGMLRVTASAKVPVTTAASKSKSAINRRQTRASGTRARAQARAGGSRHPSLATRTLTVTTATAVAPGLMQLRLLPASRYRSLEQIHGGLYATIKVTFSTPGRPTLTQSLQASFLLAAPAHSSRTHAPARKRPDKRRSTKDARTKPVRGHA